MKRLTVKDETSFLLTDIQQKVFMRAKSNLEGKNRRIGYQMLNERIERVHKNAANGDILSYLKT